MAKHKVLISTSAFGTGDPAPIKALESAGFEVILNPFKRKLTRQESVSLMAGVEGLIAGLEVLDEQLLAQSQLKVISRCGAGISNVDLKAAKRLNIQVLSTPDAPTIAVAELTIGAMLALIRSIFQMNQHMHAGQWHKMMGSQMAGKTILILGFGRIGQKVAEFLGPFQVNIIVVDPLVKKAEGVSCLALQDALPLADIITIHVNGESPLLGSAEFSLMKKGVCILNAARGRVIDELALVSALQTNKVAAAWCDVFDEEPYQGPLQKFPQVILTPHIGSYTEECRRLMEMQAAQHLIAAFQSLGCHVHP